MPVTVYLSVRGDGAWRTVEAFRRALGPQAETLVVHPNRDESGFYGSADVEDAALAREAFTQARAPYPNLKAHLSVPGAERTGSQRPTEQRPHEPHRPPFRRSDQEQRAAPRADREPPPRSGPRSSLERDTGRNGEDSERRDRGRRRPRR